MESWQFSYPTRFRSLTPVCSCVRQCYSVRIGVDSSTTKTDAFSCCGWPFRRRPRISDWSWPQGPLGHLDSLFSREFSFRGKVLKPTKLPGKVRSLDHMTTFGTLGRFCWGVFQKISGTIVLTIWNHGSVEQAHPLFPGNVLGGPNLFRCTSFSTEPFGVPLEEMESHWMLSHFVVEPQFAV